MFRSFRVGIDPLRPSGRPWRTISGDGVVDDGVYMVVDLQFSTNVAIISISGDVDIGGRPELDRVVAFAAAAAQVIVLDLGEVTFAGSTLLHIVEHAEERMGGAGGSVTIRRPSKQVRRLLAIAGLPPSVAIVE